MSGIRSSKTVDGVTHNYITQNDKVVRESYGSVVMEFIYSVDGKPFALNYSTDSGNTFITYYYLLNMQGDVVGLYDIETDSDGSIIGSGVIARYTYNAWGRILSVTDSMGAAITSSTHIANVNPLRYRGYYYDAETGFYYLQSRYYDPEICRFINADGITATGQGFLGYNMFAYCNNNPVNRTDIGGNASAPSHSDFPQWIGETLGELFVKLTREDLRTINSEDEGVSYNSNGKGKGAEIKNSYKVKTPWVMYYYVKNNRGDEVSGCTLGVVYEWVLHNIMYDLSEPMSHSSNQVKAANAKDRIDRAKHVAFGNTIYGDSAEEHGLLSTAMKASYYFFFRYFAIYDKIVQWGE